MADVVTKGCGHPGCDKDPSYGVEGGKTVEFSAPHAREGMVNVKHMRHSGCSTQTSYGADRVVRRRSFALNTRRRVW